MAWTQADLDAIDRAIAAGEKVVQYADRRVEYRSIQELLAARNAMKGNVTGGPTTDPLHAPFAGRTWLTAERSKGL